MALFARNFRTFAPMAGAAAAGSLGVYTSQVSRATRRYTPTPSLVPSGSV